MARSRALKITSAHDIDRLIGSQGSLQPRGVGARAPCPWAPCEGNGHGIVIATGLAGELADFCRLRFARLGGLNLSVSPFWEFGSSVCRCHLEKLFLEQAIRWVQVLHAGAELCQIEVSIYFLVQYKKKFGC